MKVPFPYQERSVCSVMEDLQTGLRRLILQASCGAGKTFMATCLIQRLGLKTLVAAHSRILLKQFKDDLEQQGISGCYLETIQTLNAQRSHLPVGLIVIDECHRSMARSYRELISRHPQALVLGLTATPERLDGQNLMEAQGGIFQKIVPGPSIEELARLGRLVVPEFLVSSSAKNITSSALSGNIIRDYIKRGEGRQALVFAHNVDHAKVLKSRFNSHGIDADFVSGSQRKQVTDVVFKRFMSNKLQILINVNICLEGWDYPPLEVVIIARAMTSRTMWIQAIGRAMRMAKGKSRALIIDHGGCVYRFKKPTDPWEYTFEKPDREYQRSPVKFKRCRSCESQQALSARQCTYCGHIFRSVGAREEDGSEMILLPADVATYPCKEWTGVLAAGIIPVDRNFNRVHPPGAIMECGNPRCVQARHMVIA
jgi:DNA repair protein RadD